MDIREKVDNRSEAGRLGIRPRRRRMSWSEPERENAASAMRAAKRGI